MTLTTEQSRALIDAIANASSPDALERLRRQARREYGLDIRGSFAELLIAVRLERLGAEAGERVRVASAARPQRL